MPISIVCSGCEKKLKVPDSAAGKKIRCPACKAVVEVPAPDDFVEPDEDIAVAETPIKKKPSGIKPEPSSRKRRDDDDDDYDVRRPSARRRRDDEEEEEERRPKKKKKKRQRYGTPHRGTMILLLGVGSMLCCAPLIAWIMGYRAISMANEDLAEMDRGRMDDSGQTATQIGKVCGIVGCILGVIWVILGVAFRIMQK